MTSQRYEDAMKSMSVEELNDRLDELETTSFEITERLAHRTDPNAGDGLYLQDVLEGVRWETSAINEELKRRAALNESGAEAADA